MWEATIHEHIDYFESQLTKLTTETNVTRYIGVDIKRDRKNHTITLSPKPKNQTPVMKMFTLRVSYKSR